jgi:hypothetical protein
MNIIAQVRRSYPDYRDEVTKIFKQEPRLPFYIGILCGTLMMGVMDLLSQLASAHCAG